ncbi:MAG: hypothetical protein FIA99_17505 [Ruminiclostridium sp.]|nr:hypothetical protein [Ruminiclostridium sp.]
MGCICLNEDNTHFFKTRAGKNAGKNELDLWLDQYENTQVEELIFNVNCMRTGYASKVWNTFWDGYDPEGPDDQPLFKHMTHEEQKCIRRIVHTAWQLNNDGYDVYRYWINRCREKGISPWISVRMNDVHYADNEGHCFHNDFWRKNPDLRRVNYKSTCWSDRALDYSREEVREHHFKLIEEIAERYDFNGLELDWMRFGFYFKPGHEGAGSAILTEFISRVRKLLDAYEIKRNHRIMLGARIPTRPQTALGLGMDAVEWARRGIIDRLVITPFFATIETDMPIEIWKQLLHGTGVKLAAGHEINISPYPDSKLVQYNSLESVRGAAVSLLDRGADLIYLFNYFDYFENEDDDIYNYSEILHEIGCMDLMINKPRRHILTFQDMWAPGEPKAFKLPLKCCPYEYNDIRIHIGPKPDNAEVAIILGTSEELAEDDLKVLVNGQLCEKNGGIDIQKPIPEGHAASFKVSCDTIQRGYNLIEIVAGRELTVVWAEIHIS